MSLSSSKNISHKVSKMICEELANKYDVKKTINDSEQPKIIMALKKFGYKQSEIATALKKVDSHELLEEKIKSVIKMMSNAK